MLPILLNLENKFCLSCKGLWDKEYLILFPVQLIIRVVINLTAFNVLPAHLNSSPLHDEVHILKHIILLSLRELRLLFVSAQWKSSDIFVLDHLRVLSSSQLLMKFYSYDDIFHCFFLESNR